MSIFPGNVLVIDDRFNIVYDKEPTDELDRVQYKSFVDIRTVCESNGIPLISITETTDVEYVLKRISLYSNVRLLILDLDLNNSGDIEEDDVYLIQKIILKATACFGYFLLLINSSFAEKWEEIKTQFDESIRAQKIISNLSDSYNKKDKNLDEKILSLLTKKYSIEIISQFEVGLNNAKDMVLGNFIDFSMSTWENVMFNLKSDFDSKQTLNYTITQFLIGLIKQFLINLNYSEIGDDTKHDGDLLKQIARGFNYISNLEGQLKGHPIWTGNLYKSEFNSLDKKYMLVITPECDLAQGKTVLVKIVYGFEVNETTFPETYKAEDFKDKADPPLLVKKLGLDRSGNWKKRKDIDDRLGISQHLYFLPYASENSKHLFIDFRNTESVELNKNYYKLIARVNDPLITDITDKFSALFNRKGLPNFLPKKLKLSE